MDMSRTKTTAMPAAPIGAARDRMTAQPGDGAEQAR